MRNALSVIDKPDDMVLQDYEAFIHTTCDFTQKKISLNCCWLNPGMVSITNTLKHLKLLSLNHSHFPQNI
jgi:hypothetical protein